MASRFIDALLASPLPIIMEVKRSDAEGVELIGDRPIEQIVVGVRRRGRAVHLGGDRPVVRRGGADADRRRRS